jgi:hypothetical protein
MEITEHELRAMIRDAIARHDGGVRTTSTADRGGTRADVAAGSHPSHVLFAVVSSGDGECIIEPSVACTHCGYCKSLGH